MVSEIYRGEIPGSKYCQINKCYESVTAIKAENKRLRAALEATIKWETASMSERAAMMKEWGLETAGTASFARAALKEAKNV